MTDVLWNYNSIQSFYGLSLYGANMQEITMHNVQFTMLVSLRESFIGHWPLGFGHFFHTASLGIILLQPGPL